MQRKNDLAYEINTTEWLKCTLSCHTLGCFGNALVLVAHTWVHPWVLSFVHYALHTHTHTQTDRTPLPMLWSSLWKRQKWICFVLIDVNLSTPENFNLIGSFFRYQKQTSVFLYCRYIFQNILIQNYNTSKLKPIKT